HAGARSKDIAARKIDATPNRPFAFVFKSFVSLPRSRRREDQGSARCQRSLFTMPKNVQALRCVHERVGSRAIRKPSEHSLKPSSASSIKRCFSRKPLVWKNADLRIAPRPVQNVSASKRPF